MKSIVQELVDAIKHDNHPKAQQILAENESLDVNHPTNETGMTLLILTVIYGRIRIARLLLEAGANINQTNSVGDTALHFSVRKHNQLLTELLIKNHAGVNLASKINETPLHIAARNGDHELCEILLAGGADPMIVNSAGATPIVSAANNGNDRVSELLANAAEQLVVQNEINFVVSVAITKSQAELQEMLAASETKELFARVLRVASLNNLPSRALNSLIGAIQAAYLEQERQDFIVVNNMVNSGIETSQTSTPPRHELLQLCRDGEIGKLGEYFNCLPSLRSQKGQSVLHLALMHKQLELAEKLIPHMDAVDV